MTDNIFSKKLKQKEEKAHQYNYEGLNEDQVVAFDSFIEFMSSDRTMFLLNGKAGTGKTYLTQHIVNELEATKAYKVAVTATTHKAVRVLNSKISGTVCTIHSLLNMKEHINHDGSITFVVKRMENRPADEFNVIIVDESSMITDEVFHELKNLSRSRKIIFVGDENQIPPVGFNSSLPFDPVMKEIIIKFSLTKIVRQAEGNPIIIIAGKLLENMQLTKSLASEIELEHWNKDIGVAAMPLPNLQKLCRLLFLNKSYATDKNFVRVVAWTNEEVRKISAMVREILFPNVKENIVVGDLITTNAPYDSSMALDAGNDQLTYSYSSVQNGSDLLVTELELCTMASEYGELKLYRATAEINGNPEDIGIFPILHEESYTFYAKVCNALKDMAKKAPKEESGQFWKKYYTFKRCVLDCSYAYAITCHKAQGSTYTNTIIIESNILRNTTILEMNRIRYTAITRSSHRVFLMT